MPSLSKLVSGILGVKQEADSSARNKDEWVILLDSINLPKVKLLGEIRRYKTTQRLAQSKIFLGV